MNIFDLIFNTSTMFFGVRVISILHYLSIFSIAFYYFRKQPDLKFRSKVIISLFFVIFIIMLVDWGWSFAQHLKWRGYIPSTGETAWLEFQPTPLGTRLLHDWHRWILYLAGFLISLDALWPFFKRKILSLNRYVLFTFACYMAFWIGLVFAAPNPLYVDVGLWKLWPILAAQAGEAVHVQTFFLADVVSRFLLILPFCWSWFKSDA